MQEDISIEEEFPLIERKDDLDRLSILHHTLSEYKQHKQYKQGNSLIKLKDIEDLIKAIDKSFQKIKSTLIVQEHYKFLSSLLSGVLLKDEEIKGKREANKNDELSQSISQIKDDFNSLYNGIFRIVEKNIFLKLIDKLREGLASLKNSFFSFFKKTYDMLRNNEEKSNFKDSIAKKVENTNNNFKESARIENKNEKLQVNNILSNTSQITPDSGEVQYKILKYLYKKILKLLLQDRGVEDKNQSKKFR